MPRIYTYNKIVIQIWPIKPISAWFTSMQSFSFIKSGQLNIFFLLSSNEKFLSNTKLRRKWLLIHVYMNTNENFTNNIYAHAWKFIRDNNVIEAYKIQQYFVILRMSVILVRKIIVSGKKWSTKYTSLINFITLKCITHP